MLQVTLNILDQLPHSLLQAPEQLLLSIENFISHLQKANEIINDRFMAINYYFALSFYTCKYQ